MSPSFQTNEASRLAALHKYNILDTDPERYFDEITALAAQICDTPIALVSLVDQGRQWFKSRYGIDVVETPREISFCTHVVANEAYLEVEDARQDDRFAKNPLVTGEPNIRFYAGAPLITPDGFFLGSLCAVDTKPRNLNATQKAALQTLSHQVMQLFELRLAKGKLVEAISVVNEKKVALLRVNLEMNALLNNVMEGHMLLSPDTSVINYNHNASYYMSHTNCKDLMVGTKVKDCMLPMHQTMFMQNFNKALAGEVVESAPTIPLKNNTMGWFKLKYAPALDQVGDIMGVTISMYDITNQVRAEQENKHKTTLLADIAQFQSHQLRGPLSRVMGLSSLLDPSDMGPDNQQLLHYLQLSCQELDDVVHAIVSASNEGVWPKQNQISSKVTDLN